MQAPAGIPVPRADQAGKDRAGGRIGQGGGYYDRYILKTRAFRVGVCHGFALMDSVPTEKHDERMDAVVTPEETLIFRQEERT